MGDLSTVQTTGAAGTAFNAGTIASAASGVAQIIGSLRAADLERSNADLLEALGLVNANDERRFNAALLASQINESTSSTGSALDIQLADAVEGEIEALRIQFGFDAQASVARGRADALETAGILRGTGTILGGFQRSLAQNPTPRTPKAFSGKIQPFTGSIPIGEVV